MAEQVSAVYECVLQVKDYVENICITFVLLIENDKVTKICRTIQLLW